MKLLGALIVGIVVVLGLNFLGVYLGNEMAESVERMEGPQEENDFVEVEEGVVIPKEWAEDIAFRQAKEEGYIPPEVEKPGVYLENFDYITCDTPLDVIPKIFGEIDRINPGGEMKSYNKKGEVNSDGSYIYMSYTEWPKYPGELGVFVIYEEDGVPGGPISIVKRLFCRGYDAQGDWADNT